jgi:hypothetical protein
MWVGDGRLRVIVGEFASVVETRDGLPPES